MIKQPALREHFFHSVHRTHDDRKQVTYYETISMLPGSRIKERNFIYILNENESFSRSLNATSAKNCH